MGTEVSFRFNANQFKNSLNRVLENKIQNVTTDEALYNSLLELFYTYAIKYFPEDTGALKGIGSGIGKNPHYERVPHITIKSHHGIETNPEEKRPSGSVFYGKMALARIGIDDMSVGESIQDMMMSNGEWEKFCMQAKELILRSMKNG